MRTEVPTTAEFNMESCPFCGAKNHAKGSTESYDKFCKKHNSVKFTLHDCCIDNFGKRHDSHIYEIINKGV